MKKNLFLLAIVMMFAAGTILAEGVVFDPTEVAIPEIAKAKASATTETVKTNTAAKASSAAQDAKKPSDLAKETISKQSDSFNNALYELDTAQVNIRNELLEYKAKYQEIDTQYKLLKNQRKILDGQIKSIEKRIQDIENSKTKIRKTML
ncbi:hypothetical protein II906_10325 [bacterium]|nr:hypothetical protein [bacterium]